MAIQLTRKHFTVDDYLRMVEVGLLRENERVELIEGEIIQVSPIGSRHCGSLDRATRAFVYGAGNNAIVRIQGSVILDDYTQPEPDIALLRPRDDFYSKAHPRPKDVLLLVEVAESSLEFDQVAKARVYAQTGVPEYWIADIPHDYVVVYAEPSGGKYLSRKIVRRGETIEPALLPDCCIPVETLLPTP